MKKNIIKEFIIFAVGLLVPQLIQAQGTVYLSNLGQGMGSYIGVGSNSWLSALFQTGTNAGGYALNAIQLEMGNALGNPSGFTARLYATGYGLNYGSLLGILSGSSDPATSGIYTYADDSNITLLPSSIYYIVLTAATPFVSGTAGVPLGYVLNNGPGYDASGGWFGVAGYSSSSNYGSSWSYISGNTVQYAINATAIPEPGILSLFALGGLGCLWRRRKARLHFEKRNHS